MWDRPLVSEEVYVPCRFNNEDCEGQITSDRLCDTHRSARGHRNGCQGCEHDPATFPPCWNRTQVDEALERMRQLAVGDRLDAARYAVSKQEI